VLYAIRFCVAAHEFLTSDACAWSASWLGRCAGLQKFPGTHIKQNTWFGSFGEQKDHLILWGIEPLFLGRPAPSLVTIPTCTKTLQRRETHTAQLTQMPHKPTAYSSSRSLKQLITIFPEQLGCWRNSVPFVEAKILWATGLQIWLYYRLVKGEMCE
jgi:hypothetical protein